MFTADAIIDTVQTGKKTFVNTFVTNEATKEAMIKFIDAQADYTKRAIDAGILATSTIGMIVSSKDFFDYTTNYFKSSVKGK